MKKENYSRLILVIVLVENAFGTLKLASEFFGKAIYYISLKLQNFQGKLTSTKSSQTQRNSVVEKLKIPNEKNNEESTNIDSTYSINNEEGKNRKILLIAGHHGRDMVHILKNRMNTWTINSILKSNANNSELVKTAINASKHLTRQDFVILWPNENFTSFFKHLLSSLKHTNFFILSSPFHPRNKHINDRIYYNNIALYKEAHYLTGGLKNLIEINAFLKVTNYSRSGYYINKTGKRFIGREIVNRISRETAETFMTNSTNIVSGALINENSNFQSDTPPLPLQEKSTVKPNEIIQPHFLYPRLSQETFAEM